MTPDIPVAETPKWGGGTTAADIVRGGRPQAAVPQVNHAATATPLLLPRVLPSPLQLPSPLGDLIILTKNISFTQMFNVRDLLFVWFGKESAESAARGLCHHPMHPSPPRRPPQTKTPHHMCPLVPYAWSRTIWRRHGARSSLSEPLTLNPQP